jgi:HK97 family phage major capsid protein
MTIQELNKKRSELFGRISKMRDTFVANGNQWSSNEEAAGWDRVNEDYNKVMDNLERAQAVEGMNNRIKEIDERNGRVINPHNIGLDDAGDGLVGGRPAPGGGRRSQSTESRPREFAIDKDGRKIPIFGREHSLAAALPAKVQEKHRGVTLGGYLRGMVCGARTRQERNALGESGGSTGGYTVPTFLASELIDLLRAKSSVIAAGAKTIPMPTAEMSFAKLTSEPSATWANEHVSIDEATGTFGQINFTARTLRMLVIVSRELLEDSANLNAKLPEVFARVMAAELDRVALLGTGAGTGSGIEPIGVLNMSDVNVVEMGTNGAAVTDYSQIIDCVEAIETDNAESPTHAIMHPRTKAAYAKLEDSTGQPLMRPELLKDMRFLTTTKLSITETQGSAENASSVVIGGFNELIIGVRSQVKIRVLEERYAEKYQVGFLVSMRGDVGAFHEEAFAKLIGIIPA